MDLLDALRLFCVVLLTGTILSLALTRAAHLLAGGALPEAAITAVLAALVQRRPSPPLRAGLPRVMISPDGRSEAARPVEFGTNPSPDSGTRKGPQTMTRAPFRLFRSGLIGAVILGLAAGGHLAGGGQLPEPAILTALCAVAMIPVAVLTRFRLSFPVLAGLLGAGQAWLHWSFGALSAGMPATVPEPMAHGHAGHAAAALAPEIFSQAVPASAAGMDGLMFAAHAVATLGTALLLARGEQALSALAAWLRPLVQLPAPHAIGPVRVPGPAPAPVILPMDRPGRRLPTRRGPPAFVPAA
jgi:hypothetical protein